MKKLKSKIVNFALSLCLIFPCMFMITACKEDHIHTLTKVDAVTETCTSDGNTLYYKCDCGKYFSDEEAKTEINKDSWIVVKTGHSYSNTWTYNDTHHWKEATCSHSTEKGYYAEHSLTNNECECGYISNLYTVTNSNEWNELFTGDYLINGSVSIVDYTYENDVVVPERTYTSNMKSTETAMFMSFGEQPKTGYLVKDGENWYAIEKDGNEWYGNVVSNQFVSNYTFAGSQGTYFVNKFASFNYDETNHCYVAENFEIDSIPMDYVKVYIENSKLVKIEFKKVSSSTSYDLIVYSFSDYGTTTIDIPEWSVESQIKYTITDSDEWNELFTGDYLINGTLNVVDLTYYENEIVEEETLISFMKSTATVMSNTITYEGETRTQYVIKDGEKWYAVVKVENDWFGEEVSYDVIEGHTYAGGQGYLFADKFASFEYDETNHCYVAENLKLYDGDDGTADYVKVYAEDGKLAKVEIKVTIEEDIYFITTYEFSNFGTTTIDDVPEWSLLHPPVVFTVADGNEWNEVFTGDYLTNGTINIGNNLYVEDILDPEQSGVMTMKSTETSMSMVMVEAGETVLCQYLVKEDDTWYALTEVENAWKGIEVTVELVEKYSFAGGQGTLFTDRFDEFEYDEENCCYFANDFDLDGESTAEYVKVYIENGKLIRMEIKVEVSADSYGISEYIFSDYGTTIIEVPEWTQI